MATLVNTPQTLTIDRLNKSYGSHQVLTDMSLQVSPGEIYGFVGSNGAGKSTTMRIALGVLSADSGEVRIGNNLITDDVRRTIGYMPEERGLYAKEGIADQLIFFARIHGSSAAQAHSEAHELLERLGLADHAKDKLESLSLGNQQRVQLAASLIHSPSLLILDEPFSGLDPIAVKLMADLLLDRSATGVPILFSSHQLDLVQRLCHRVGIIAHGRMKVEGTVEQLRSRGPMLYDVHTPARDWYPLGTSVVEEHANGVLLDAGEIDDQLILNTALAAGPVHSFSRHIPHLTELFQEVIEQ